MAEEVKKIITVEVGKSITSVRDFKKHIEDLRGALLGLNEESEEYKTIAEQIATDQEKLNEVMKVGKGNTDSAAGSYNELNNQLKALRQQYKALSETERNGATGQAILQNITKLDTELKDIDESMGQYYRNVGNYKGAFEEAFKAMAQNIGNINPELGKLMRTAAQLIPLIKAASKAATTGLKGIKAGLASTGIGLLVVALGEIVAHWEQISNWIDKILGKQKQLTTETKNTANALENYSSTLSEALSNYQSLLESMGYTSDEQYILSSKRLGQEKRDWESYLRYSRNVVKELEDLKGKYEKYRDPGFGRLNDVENEKKVLKEFEGLGIEFRNAAKNWNGVVEEFKSPMIVGSIESGMDPGTTEFNKAIDKEIAVVQKQIEKLEGYVEDVNKEQGKLDTAYDKLANRELFDTRKRAEELGKTQTELRQKQYEDDLVAAKQRLDARMITQEEYDEYVINQEKLLQHDLKEIRKKEWESSDAFKDLEQAKQSAKSLYDSLKDYGKNELQILDENYQAQLALLERFGYDTTALTKKYQEDRQALIDKDTQEGLEKLKEAEEEALRIRREGFQKALDLQSNTEFLDTSAAETKWTINTKTHETDETLEYQKQDRLYEIAEQGYKDRIELYKQYLETLDETSDEHLDISRELHEEEMGLAKLQYDYQVELEDRLLEKKRKNLQIMQGMFQAYGELGSTVAGLIADASEEGTERWKAARITETVINTISGAAGAFMQGMSSYPQPWGAIIGAAGAAVATATGAAQIAKIKSTQIGTSSVSGIAANSSGVGVEPLLNPDYDLQRMTNLSLQSDAYLPGKTQVYVLESDIQEVGNRVQVRENNATF